MIFLNKKITIIIIILGVLFLGKIKAEKQIIPKDAIRLRVVANSNSSYDQTVKMKVSERIQKDLYQLLKNTKGIEEARKVIQSNLNKMNISVEETLKENNYPLDYSVHFGDNYFPSKKYKGITYEAGYYESLLVTLGEGKGKNWWCVLFPPLCLIEAEESNKVEYKFFVKEILEKYL